ncbi:SprT family zinc-dependent metalloprotease [Desulfonatronum parangueonense]
MIVPKSVFTPKVDLEMLIRSKSSWIIRHLDRFRSRKTESDSPESLKLPDSLDLQAIREQWFITYAASHGSRHNGQVRIREAGPNTLHLTSAVAQPATCAAALQQWVRQRAAGFLPAWLKQISDELDLPFSKVTIRNQHTRWGSCTRGKNISLNCKLLFLPRQWARYVLVHELCHTRVMNHGPDFWSLMHKYEPQSKQIRQAMRLAWQELPAWMVRKDRIN